VSRSEATLEDIFALLPDLDELESLRLALVGIAIPDPGKAWDSSNAYATVDKRIVSAGRLEEAVNESEENLHRYVSSLFDALRPLFRSFWSGDSIETAHRLIALGAGQEEHGLYRKARLCYDVALAYALPLPDKKPQILALRRIARMALSLGGFQEALSYYQRCAELAHDSGDLHAEIIALTGCGNVRLWQGRWADAESSYREVLNLIDSADTQGQFLLERAQLYNNLGNAATRQMHLGVAEDWFEKGLEVWADIESPFDRAVCYHNKALLRDLQGRREEARDCYRQSLELPIPSGMWAGIAIDLAESYLRDGHVSKAEEWGRAAEERAISARSPYFLGRMYHGRGNIARALGDEGGFTFFEKALQIAREKGYPLLEGEALVDYARLRIQTGGEEEAQAYLDRAKEIFTGMGAMHELARVEQASHELHRFQTVSAKAAPPAQV
jgi:tetratricopeptide (TPR) repeat protein